MSAQSADQHRKVALVTGVSEGSLISYPSLAKGWKLIMPDSAVPLAGEIGHAFCSGKQHD